MRTSPMTARRGAAALAMFCLAAMVPVVATAQAFTPARGTALREAVLDAVRPMVESEVGRPVEFVVDQFNMLGEWAFVRLTPQRPGGGAIAYVYTRYQQAVDDGAFSGQVTALVRETPSGWLVYAYDLGATDAVWFDWQGAFPVPPEVFEIR